MMVVVVVVLRSHPPLIPFVNGVVVVVGVWRGYLLVMVLVELFCSGGGWRRVGGRIEWRETEWMSGRKDASPGR